VFRSNDPASPVLLPVEGNGHQPRPRFEITPPAFDFGRVPVGQLKALLIAFANRGDADLVVESVSGTNSAFSVFPPLSLPAVLPAGVEVPLALLFVPAASGVAADTLVAESTDTNSPARVPVRGEGYATKGYFTLDVTPDRGAWTIRSPWGSSASGSGDVPKVLRPTGVYTVEWDTLPGYYPPTNFPALANLRTGATTRVTGVHIPLAQDRDEDGMPDWEEYIAGTDAGSATSLLRVVARCATAAPSRVLLSWPSASGRDYAVYGSSNLPAGFAPLRTNLPATPPVNVYTDALPPGSGFYRIGVWKPGAPAP
jgi:hypothetical protein